MSTYSKYKWDSRCLDRIKNMFFNKNIKVDTIDLGGGLEVRVARSRDGTLYMRPYIRQKSGETKDL